MANPDIELPAGDSRSRYATPVQICIRRLSRSSCSSNAFDLFPGEYYADRARVTLEDENPSSAISYANEALKWEQRNPNIFFYLGRALEALGNDKDKKEERIPFYVDALAAFDKARLLARSKKIIRWISLSSTTSSAASPKPNGCTASLDRSIRAPSRYLSFIKTTSTTGKIPHPKKNRKLKTEN